MREHVTFGKWQVGKICRQLFYIGVIATTLASAQTPLQSSARLRLAQDLERMGQYDRAAEIYFSLFNADPRDGSYYFGLKRVLLELRQYDELITAINRRLQTIDDITTRVDLADVYYKRGDSDRAQTLWKDLLQENPQPGTYSAVAAAMIDNRLYEEALQIYLQGRQQLRNSRLFVLELANLYTLRLNFTAATQEYLSYLEANPRQFPFVQSKVNELARDDEKRMEAVVATLEHK
ncbi:MAG: tetratricopeptide repeat protein, partial [candidate division KSB1 bacterium]|nr:tetratricopeptide repeat protein [candidate division KSB1 bacterium]